MALTTATIKSKLATASWSTTDNVAQSLVNGAGAADLKSLDVEGVLRLHEAMKTGWVSDRDRAALAALRRHTQYQLITSKPDEALAVIKAATTGNACVQRELDAALVKRIYAAENKRLSWHERVGVDGSTIGRGQLGQAAFTDVTSTTHYGAQWGPWVERYIGTVQ